jgi:hypothetical protein
MGHPATQLFDARVGFGVMESSRRWTPHRLRSALTGSISAGSQNQQGQVSILRCGMLSRRVGAPVGTGPSLLSCQHPTIPCLKGETWGTQISTSDIYGGRPLDLHSLGAPHLDSEMWELIAAKLLLFGIKPRSRPFRCRPLSNGESWTMPMRPVPQPARVRLDCDACTSASRLVCDP